MELNKVFAALKKGLLGEDNDKKDIMIAIMNKAVSAHKKADRNHRDRYNDREFDFDEESDKEQL